MAVAAASGFASNEHLGLHAADAIAAGHADVSLSIIARPSGPESPAGLVRMFTKDANVRKLGPPPALTLTSSPCSQWNPQRSM
jgi:hypothetical protein